MSTNSQKARVVPRGIRNNNPLNIRVGNVWLGEVKDPTDGEFEQFVSMAYGLRAAFVLLRRYIGHYHLDTPRLIISRWAPNSENSTDKYLSYVCAAASLDADTHLSFDDAESLCNLVAAMARFECGVSIPMDTIVKGYRMS